MTGCFDIHIDHPKDNTSIALFDMFDPVRHESEHTHVQSHILDLVISNLSISSLNVMDFALSDHFRIMG